MDARLAAGLGLVIGLVGGYFLGNGGGDDPDPCGGTVITLGADTAIVVGADSKIVLDADSAMVVGADSVIVIGSDSAMVVGADCVD